MLMDDIGQTSDPLCRLCETSLKIEWLEDHEDGGFFGLLQEFSLASDWKMLQIPIYNIENSKQRCTFKYSAKCNVR